MHSEGWFIIDSETAAICHTCWKCVKGLAVSETEINHKLRNLSDTHQWKSLRSFKKFDRNNSKLKLSSIFRELRNLSPADFCLTLKDSKFIRLVMGNYWNLCICIYKLKEVSFQNKYINKSNSHSIMTGVKNPAGGMFGEGVDYFLNFDWIPRFYVPGKYI